MQGTENRASSIWFTASLCLKPKIAGRKAGIYSYSGRPVIVLQAYVKRNNVNLPQFLQVI